MKRAYLGLLLLLLCVFAACSSDNNNNSAGYPTPTPSPSATPTPSSSPTVINTVKIKIVISGAESEPPTISFEPNPASVGRGQEVVFEVENKSANPATTGMTVVLEGFQQGGPTGPRLFGDGIWNNTFVMHDVNPTSSEDSNPVRGSDGEYSYGAVLFEQENGNKIGEDRRPQIIVGNLISDQNQPRNKSASPTASTSSSPAKR